MANDARPSDLQIWISAMRLRTLPAAIAPVLVGTAMASRYGTASFAPAFTCLLFALLIQIGTNFANDYFDFKKGADTAERVGPKRAVASGWVTPGTMRLATIVVFASAFVVGLSLLPLGGWPLLVIGVASILSGIAYTGGPYPLGYNGLGDVFVFVFFGLVAVGTTYFVQARELTRDVLLAGVGVGALATNILLVNNYRDVETDAKAGKRTLVVRFGRGFARTQFLVALAVAFGVPVNLYFQGYSWFVLAPLLALPLALSQVKTLREATTPQQLIELLGDTGRLLALYALLLSGGVIW